MDHFLFNCRRDATLSGQSGLTMFELRQVGDFGDHGSQVLLLIMLYCKHGQYAVCFMQVKLIYHKKKIL